MAKNFNHLKKAMNPESLKQAQAKTREMMSEMLLAELRKDSGITQQELADIVGIKQPSLSKLESQADMQISTLQKLIAALGGELEIIAHMPKGDVRITQFSDGELHP